MGRGNEQTVQMYSLALQMSSQCRELSCLLASKEDKQIQQISEKILNIIFTESEVTQSCPTLWDPMDCAASQAPPSMGFSRQEYWSGVPLPSPGESSQLRD